MIQKRLLLSVEHFLYEPKPNKPKVFIHLQTTEIYSFITFFYLTHGVTSLLIAHTCLSVLSLLLLVTHLLICCHRHVVDVRMPPIVLLGFCSVRLLDYEGMLPIWDKVVWVQLISIC